MKKNHSFMIDLILIIILVAIDQITKKLALHFLSEKSFTIIPRVFSFTLLEGGNSGAAFGLLQGGFWFFVISTIVVIFFCILFLRRVAYLGAYLPIQVSLVLLLAGAFGNFIDRVTTMVEYNSSFVVDFLYFELIDFPIFNVADCYITISAFLLILFGGFYYKEKDFDLILGRKTKKRVE